MKEIVWNTRLAADTTYEVIVIGGGPAGCAAAAAAARAGRKTLLIEQTGALGGMSTSGLIPTWGPYTDGRQIIYRGLAESIFRLGKVPTDEDRLDWVPIDTEKLKAGYDALMSRYGVTVLFHSFMAEAAVTGSMVDAVIVANKSGLNAYSAAMYIDCTGDADLAVRAGAEFRQGETPSGERQPMTLCFKLANVDPPAYRQINFRDTGPESLIARIVNDDTFPLLIDSHRCNAMINPGIVGFNSGHIFEIDGTNPSELSAAMAQGRQIAAQFHAALRKYAPAAFGSSVLVETAPLMGVRETRRIVGDYVLTVKDYLARRSFKDEIGRNSYFLDAHRNVPRNSRYLADLAPDQSDGYRPGESHGIPYRCLTPRGLDNVLVAGRCISTDRTVNSSIRIMPACLVTGEAAGTAAAMATVAGLSVHDLPTEELRTVLRQNGVYLP